MQSPSGGPGWKYAIELDAAVALPPAGFRVLSDSLPYSGGSARRAEQREVRAAGRQTGRSEGLPVPTAAHLRLEFEDGQCPHCGAALQLEFGDPLKRGARQPVESANCPECGRDILAQTRGSRFWYTPQEFAEKDTPAMRLVRSSRQWFALAVELHLAAVELMGVDKADLSEQFERADAALRGALAPALDRARDQIAGDRTAAP
jgi:hypothetical protein